MWSCPAASITRTLAVTGEPIVEWMRAVHPTTTYTTSVCTGALLLGAAGILDGIDATTHWIAYDHLARPSARDPTEQRVVQVGKVITAAGVSAGIDLALHLVGPDPRARTWPRASSSGSSTTPSRPTTPVRPPRHRPEILELVEAVMPSKEAAAIGAAERSESTSA